MQQNIGHPLHFALQTVLCACTVYYSQRPERMYINARASTVGVGLSFPGIVEDRKRARAVAGCRRLPPVASSSLQRPIRSLIACRRAPQHDARGFLEDLW
jgi:hypothetical protein